MKIQYAIFNSVYHYRVINSSGNLVVDNNGHFISNNLGSHLKQLDTYMYIDDFIPNDNWCDFSIDFSTYTEMLEYYEEFLI